MADAMQRLSTSAVSSGTCPSSPFLPVLPKRSSLIQRHLPSSLSPPSVPARASVRAAAADGPSAVPRPLKPSAPVAPAPPPSPSQAGTQEAAEEKASATTKAPSAAAGLATVSLEYQRQMAKELVAYFQEKKFEQVSQSQKIVGWTRRNEIGNGRWVMFGLAVGLLTEYATGVNFPSQIAIVLENLGIID